MKNTETQFPLKQTKRRLPFARLCGCFSERAGVERKPALKKSNRIKAGTYAKRRKTLTRVNRTAQMLIVSLALIATSLNGVVHATATTNDDYRHATQVYVKSAASVTSCTENTNVTGSWSSFINDSSQWLVTTDQSTYAFSFAGALSSGAWAVNQFNDVGGAGYVDIYWYDALYGGTSSVNWDGSGAVTINPPSAQHLHWVRLGDNKTVTGTGGCVPKVVAYGTKPVDEGEALSFDPDTTSQDVTNLLVGGIVTINYPTGYIGIPVSRTAALAQTVYPVINYTVNNYEVDASYGYNLDYHAPDTVVLKWKLYKVQTGGALTLVGSEVDTQESEHAKIKISEQGNYALSLEYYIVPPATFDPTNVNQLRPTSVAFNYDGTPITQSSLDMTCADGACTAVSPYENCTTYGTDIIGGFGCLIRNFGISIQAFLKYLFIPNAAKLKDNFDAFSSQLELKLGFLLYPVTFLVTFFTSFNDTSNNWCSDTSCTKDFGTLFGKHYVVNFTQLKDTIPTMYEYMLTAIRALTIFGLLYMLRRKYLEVMEK